MPVHLAGAHVVVTGATRGIGLALAAAFAAAGAAVTAVARPGARLDALTALDPAIVAARVVRVVERGRGSVVMPALVAPTHHLRALPSYLTDGLLAGIR